MTLDLAGEESALRGRREAYARVTVVWARSPVSARAGDAALVTVDGRLQGWVGGSCTEPVVVRQALEVLAEGRPRLLHLAPPDELPPAREGMVSVPVTCQSEGSVEVFIEPRPPRPRLVVVGRSPLVEALATMAGAIDFEVLVVERDAAPPLGLADAGGIADLDLVGAGVGADAFVVVATMGRYDEDALEAALATGARYVALVASERRAAAVRAVLGAAGVAEEDLARVRSPAGLDLGDLPHPELAVAILAEIVAEKAAGGPPPVPASGAGAPAFAQEAVDPVCGMTVDPGSAADRSEHGGTTYWFCASGCRRRFEAEPDHYLVGVHRR